MGKSVFSVMCRTRDTFLDDLTRGYSLAAEPLGKEVLATSLQFGLLRESDLRLTRRVGFGLPGEVDLLRKSHKPVIDYLVQYWNFALSKMGI